MQLHHENVLNVTEVVVGDDIKRLSKKFSYFVFFQERKWLKPQFVVFI